jgi:hypothetical protein
MSFDLDRYLDEFYRMAHDDPLPEPRKPPRETFPKR